MRGPGSEDLIRGCASPAETAALAAALGATARPGDFLALFGPLGAGKTLFAAAFCGGLGIDPAKVDSPSFVLMNRYEGRLPVFHFDAYRLEGEEEELAELGFFDDELESGVVLLEWADRVDRMLPPRALRIHFELVDESVRRLRIEEPGERVRAALASC